MTSRILGVLVLLAGVLRVGAQTPATASPGRVGIALVIGNSKYAQAELPTVSADRETMATALQSLGFKVLEVADLNRPRDFEDEIRTFLKTENAATEDILVVYYSGHGLQIEGKAYLVGTGITGSSDMSATLREYSIDIDRIIAIMEQAAPAARVLIVDACRNNAFAATPRKAGVAFQNSIEDTYILFANRPGETVPARSENSLQSPFTAGLLYAFENSDAGIERRFEIAQAKTRELNPEQDPKMEKSELSKNRDRPFLDHGGRSVPTQSAGQLLNSAEELYHARSWKAFQDRIRAARVLSAEPDLNTRLDKEIDFSKLVLTAQEAEADAHGSRWADAAFAWQRAGLLFETRAWVLERAALCWLLADHIQEAAGILARLQGYALGPMSDRAAQMLSGLIKADSSLEAVAKSAISDAAPHTGVEFERYAPR
jgi:hypothetical protein